MTHILSDAWFPCRYYMFYQQFFIMLSTSVSSEFFFFINSKLKKIILCIGINFYTRNKSNRIDFVAGLFLETSILIKMRYLLQHVIFFNAAFFTISLHFIES